MASGLLGSAEMEYLTGHIGSAYRQIIAVSFVVLLFTQYLLFELIYYRIR